MSDSFREVSILGSGNVAWQLAHHFQRVGIAVQQIVTRTDAGKSLAISLETKWTPISEFEKCDNLFFCVPEGAILDILGKYTISAQVAIHCSGSLAMSALDSFTGYGVFYPLQTMTYGRLLSSREIPVCIEANTSELSEALVQLAERLGFQHRLMDSLQRKQAHLSAVMVNNFSNHLWYKAAEYAVRHQIDPQLFEPLIQETLMKFRSLGGMKAQTGPARRGDEMTIRSHLNMLDHDRDTYTLYQAFSESIKHEFE